MKDPDTLDSGCPGPKPQAVVAPFFVLNGDLKPHRLREMAGQCKEAGFDSIILHAREGLRTPYMSEAWLNAVDCSVKSSEALGMKSWLYDEFPYPSGVAGGRVVQRNPDFAEKHLEIRKFQVEGGNSVTQSLGRGCLLHAFLVPCDAEGACRWQEARDATANVGLCNSTWITKEWDSRHYYDPNHSKLYHCRRSTEAFSEQVFYDDLPDGPWLIIAFFQETGGDFVEPFGDYVDVSNRAATQAFLEETHARYRTRFGARFGGQIPGIFTDEPKYRNELPWSQNIAQEWSEYRHNPIALLALAGKPGGEDARRTYRETASRLFLKNWVQPIRDWCRSENLQFIGHISPEEDWWIESRFAGSVLNLIREFTIPGCDLIIPAVGDREHPILNLTPTMAVSAAAQSGATHALCEAYGCSDYSLDPQTLKRIGDWLAICGINFFVPHGCFYSLDGMRRFDGPPTFLPPMTLHKHLARWSEDLRRTASLLGPHSGDVDIALVRPMATIYGLADSEKNQADALFQSAMQVALSLHERGIHFHWLDDEDLLDALPRNGELQFREARYRRLVVFEEPRLLRHKVALDSIRSAAIKVLDANAALHLKGSLRCPEGDVRAVRARDVPRYFCVNLSPDPREFKLEKVSCWLEGYESRWIALNVHSDCLPPKPVRRVPLGSDWKFFPPERNFCRLLQWNWGPENSVRELGPMSDILSGGTVPMAPLSLGLAPIQPELKDEVSATYRTDFIWEGRKPSTPLHLLIEAEGITGQWSASLNGKALGNWKSDPCGVGGIGHEIPRNLIHENNMLEICVTTKDARDGLILPPLLSGPFCVCGLDPVRLCASQKEVQATDWASSGYPHFSGTLDFETKFSWTEEDGEAWLFFEKPPAGCVEVVLNGKALGQLLWSPWRLPVAKALAQGLNHLRLRVTNTLQNFMHGQALPSGPLDGAQIEVFSTTRTQPAP